MVLRARVARLIVVALVIFAIGHNARAQQGRDFAGFYDVTGAFESGTDIWFTLTVDIWNHGTNTLVAATVALQDSILPGDPLHQFHQVDIASRAKVRLSGAVRVPLREFESWQKGATPRLDVRFIDGQGQTIRRSVELVRLPLGEGQ